MTFSSFFRALWGEDKSPFPWQERLAEKALAGDWPGSIGLPTAAGKTALIDIAVYALAMGAPNAARRIFFVVDRRIIVDEAAARAEKIARKLREAEASTPLGEVAARLREIGDGANAPPLETATLRGGTAKDDTWAKSPRQPVVVCSTVDQLGSSLLFRAYGTNRYMWPIRAALAAHDSLIVLDEAHISQPFAQTLQRIEAYRKWAEMPVGKGLRVVEMSATPRGGEAFAESPEDTGNTVLKGRWTASKRAVLVEIGKESEEAAGGYDALVRGLTEQARSMRNLHGAPVVGVIANRVRTARAVYQELKGDGTEAILMTGRARSYDRDRLWEEWKGQIGLGRAVPSKPVFVVATQCIEVGANIDFDALVTEAASIDALEQRFGRLNRDGRDGAARAAIVAQKDQIGARAEDRIYGKALSATWRWLKGQVQKEDAAVPAAAEGKKKAKPKKTEFVEMGVLVLRQALREVPDRASLTAERRDAPVLMPSHVDLLGQTSPEPAVSPDPALFLHGPETEPADVQVIWRADLPKKPEDWCDTVAICSPSAAEAISLPLWVVQKWLCQQPTPDVTDMEGLAAEEMRRIRDAFRPALRWQGPDDSRVLQRVDEVRPGMTLIVPAFYGGCDEWGWNPESTKPVDDVGDAVKLAMGRPILRLDETLAKSWGYGDLAKRLRVGETPDDARQVLGEFDTSGVTGWVPKTIGALVALKGRIQLAESPDSGQDGWAALSGRTAFEQESSRSAFTTEVGLDNHLGGCARWAEGFAADLPTDLRETVVLAARLHDIGKADPRFQAWLRGGNRARTGELLAKSKKSGTNGAAIERARVLAGYPKGGRHELVSVALLEGDTAEAEAPDRDLLLHLVGSHHGRCRPFAPVEEARESVEVQYGARTASSDHGLENIASGVRARFWMLTKRYGWYGLAYLETLVRLADHRRSEEEGRGDV